MWLTQNDENYTKTTRWAWCNGVVIDCKGIELGFVVVQEKAGIQSIPTCMVLGSFLSLKLFTISLIKI